MLDMPTFASAGDEVVVDATVAGVDGVEALGDPLVATN